MCPGESTNKEPPWRFKLPHKRSLIQMPNNRIPIKQIQAYILANAGHLKIFMCKITSIKEKTTNKKHTNLTWRPYTINTSKTQRSLFNMPTLFGIHEPWLHFKGFTFMDLKHFKNYIVSTCDRSYLSLSSPGGSWLRFGILGPSRSPPGGLSNPKERYACATSDISTQKCHINYLKNLKWTSRPNGTYAHTNKFQVNEFTPISLWMLKNMQITFN